MKPGTLMAELQKSTRLNDKTKATADLSTTNLCLEHDFAHQDHDTYWMAIAKAQRHIVLFRYRTKQRTWHERDPRPSRLWYHEA